MTVKENIIPNKIYFTTNIETLIEVVKKTDEIKKSDMLKEDFIKRLAHYIYGGSGMVLVSFNDKKKLNGCMVLTRQRDKQGDYLWIDFAWCDPHEPELMKNYQEEVIGTAKIRGIERIQARTARNSIKALNKKYGFYEIGKIIEKKVI